MALSRIVSNLPVCCVRKTQPIGVRTAWFKRLYLKEKLFGSKDIEIPDNLEIATGKEKLFQILEEKGIDDPFMTNKYQMRGPATKDNPCLVPSYEDSRIVGCLCEEDQAHVKFMWLHRSEPKRCECGHYFKLVDAPDLYKLAYGDKNEWSYDRK